MAETKSEQAAPVEESTAKPDEQQTNETFTEGSAITSWEWYDAAPDPEDVKTKLKELPDVWGVAPGDFAEFVVPLSQRKKISRRGEPEAWVEAWSLYFTVAGRIAMVNAAAEKNHWAVEFEPEFGVPEGNPVGYIVFDKDREDGEIVYREHVKITQLPITAGDVTADAAELGSRSGTARVPYRGGTGAVGSNRYEKMETAARGRALAGWGFGVLPGSGVASLEEMRSIVENRQTGQSQGRGRGRGQQQQQARPRPEVEAEIRTTIEELRQAQDQEESVMAQRVVDYAERTYKKTLGFTEEGAMDFRELKDGELLLLLGRMKSELGKAQAEAPL